MDPTNRKPSPHAQPSIRAFFQPKQPNYVAPPSSSTATTSNNTPPEREEAITDSSIELQPTAKPPLAPIPPPLPAPPAAKVRQQPQFDLPVLPPPPSLHPQASIVPIAKDHIPALRRINSLLLQVAYPDSFYTNILNPSITGLFSRVILWSDNPTSSSSATSSSSGTPPKVVGSLVCRVEDIVGTTSQVLYIQSLGLLSPYRSLGLATATLEHILSSAALSSLSPGSGWDIRSIYAHVWTENEAGLKWYAARGFKWQGHEPVRGYYHKLRPDTAWIVTRDLSPSSPSSSSPMSAERTKLADLQVAAAGTAKESVLANAVNLPSFASQQDDKDSDNTVPTPPLRPSTAAASLSYQKTRPETEWNDLPLDMVAGNGGPPKAAAPARPHLSAPVSGASSRSSSAARKKKERAYPAAAFGK